MKHERKRAAQNRMFFVSADLLSGAVFLSAQFKSIELLLLFVICIFAVELLLLGQQVETYRAAGVHVVLGVEVVLEHLEHAVLLLADVALKPRCEHLADAVMVAYGRAGALDGVEDGAVVCLERLLVLHLGQEDEVEVCALRVAV